MARSQVHAKSTPVLHPNSTLFDPEEESVNKRNARLDRIRTVFKTSEWQDYAQQAKAELDRTKPTSIDDLIEVLFSIRNAPDKTKVINLFIRKFADFDKSKINDKSDARNCTVLYSACRSGCPEIVDILLSDPRINVNGYQFQTVSSSSTCLHGANWGGYYEIVAQLLMKGSYPQKNISDGEEALFPYEEKNDQVPADQLNHLDKIWEIYIKGLSGLEYFLPNIKSKENRNPSRSNKEREMSMKGSFQKTTGGEEVISGKGYGDLGGIDDDPFAALEEPSEKSVFDPQVFAINDRFQRVTAKLFELKKNFNEIPDTLYQLNMEFVEVSRDFLHIAATISKVIISEVHLPLESKTIRPKQNVGGVIGGDKYIVQAVLFKFAVQRPRIGVSSEIASKIAGHELKSLSHLWECKIPDVFLPLQCLIDYLGFRMIAMLLLPLDGEKTLKVGSADAGKTYHAESESLLKKFELIGKSLNLAPHTLHDKTIYGPFDIEGHVGTDNKEYIIDFSRLFPPVPVAKQYPAGHLYRLFRPEFVKRYPKQLCSDGFTEFVEDPQLNRDLVDAEKYLIEQCIPEFSTFFAKMCTVVIKRNMVVPGNFVFNISRTLHEAGINVRYLGLVYKHCDSQVQARKLLLVEMAARVIKQRLRERIREKMSELKFPQETPYIELLVQYLNAAIFAKKVASNFVPQNKQAQTKENPAHVEAWQFIQENVLSYFELAQEIQNSSDLQHLSAPLSIRNNIWNFSVRTDESNYHGPILLFDRIRLMMGFEINPSFLNRLYSGLCNELKTIVITGIGQKIKHMNIISHAEGWLLRTVDPEFALKRFDIARDSLPLNKYTLRNYASLTVALEKRKHLQGVNKLLYQPHFVTYIKYIYNLALSEDSKDTHTLYQYGHFLNLIGEYINAEEYLIQAIENHPDHKEAWIELVKCLGVTLKNNPEVYTHFTTIVAMKMGK